MAKRTLSVETKIRKIVVKTIDGKNTNGCVNIVGHERLSDFLRTHDEDYLMVFNGGVNQDKTLFFMKRNIVSVEDCIFCDSDDG